MLSIDYIEWRKVIVYLKEACYARAINENFADLKYNPETWD